MAKSIWHRGAIRLNRRNGGEEVIAGVEGVLPGETVHREAVGMVADEITEVKEGS